MSGKTFCDANLLIYAHDVDAGAKHDIAKAALTELWNERSGVVSPQVLQEFYVNVTRKTGTPLPNSAARAIVRSYEIWCVEVGTSEVLSAFRIEDEAQIGFGTQ